MTNRESTRPRPASGPAATKARPTTYRGIRMRSRLEADFAAFLDRAGSDWDYEPECFAGPHGQWLPDFRARTPGDGPWTYFEVKPESLPDDGIDQVLTQMTVTWLSDPDAILQMVIWPYGNPEGSSSFMGFPRPDDDDEPVWWYTEGGSDRMTPWPGMGQLEAFIERARREESEAPPS